MFKKILLILLLFFSFSNLSFADWETPSNLSSTSSLSSPDFVIDTWLFSPGWSTIKKDTAEKTVQSLLLTIIEKLIIVIWVLALAIMVIWAWFMIIYHGEDSLLTKWKNIFMGWIYGIVLALSAEIIVKFVAYLLY